MNPPRTVHELVSPILELLARKIRERGFTELEVEETLGLSRHRIHFGGGPGCAKKQ